MLMTDFQRGSRRSSRRAGLRYDLAVVCSAAPVRSGRERKASAQGLAGYINTITPEEREMPGFQGKLAKWDRHRHGNNASNL